MSQSNLGFAVCAAVLVLSGCVANAPKPAASGLSYNAQEVLAVLSQKLENPNPEIYGRCGYVTSPDSDVLNNGKLQRGVCFFDKNSLVFTPIDKTPLSSDASDYSLIRTPYKSLQGAGLSDRLSPNTRFEASQVQMKKPDGSVIGVTFASVGGKTYYDLEKPEVAVNFLWQKKVPKIKGGAVWSAQSPAPKVDPKNINAYRPPLSANGERTFENFTGEGAPCISSVTSFPRMGDDVNVRIEYIGGAKTSGVGAFWIGDHGKTGPYCVAPGFVNVTVFAVASDKALNKNFALDAKIGAKYEISAKVNGDNFDFRVMDVAVNPMVVIQAESVPWNKFVDPDSNLLLPLPVSSGSLFYL